MGAGASWWWDNWIEPNNLYVHYRGLSNFASALDFQNGAFVFRRPTMTTSVYSGLNLRGNLGWGIKAPANDFTVGADGILTPGLNNLSGYLYGQPFHPDLYNGPVTFHVVYPAEGAFSVNVGTLSPYPPVGLRINVDGGADKFNGTVSAATTYSVAVPAGPHILAVDSTLNDWMQVSYTFSPYVPRLKAYALQGPATVAAWITNRKYNHADLALNGPPAPVGGIIRFAGLSLNGIWGLEWWDPLTGALVASGAATSSGGQMDVDVPPTTWDKAVILRYNTVPLPTSTIPPTATPTVTPIKPDKVMVVPNLLTKEHPTAEFRVPDPATLRVNIYNLAGERVGVVQGDPGTGRCTWDSGRMADDLYLAVAEAVGSNGFKRRQILRLMVKK
jgi:hypothetical protein